MVLLANKPCPPPQGKHQLATPWPSRCLVPRDNNPETWHHRIHRTTLGIAKSLHQARVNMEMLQMGAPGMQPGSWDRVPPAGIELRGLAGSEGTQNSLPAKRGNSQFLGVCASVFASSLAMESSCRCLLERFLYVARIANGGIKAQPPSLRSLQQGFYRSSYPGPSYP